ncbi:MAG: hypothetical protein ABTS16_06835 [Candidatus Accumulibacter phosphatis]|jgi:hypothetical protein|uniref:hypothetical protein n=1 Tax=Candidatus Accumulibacter contiguus TaxID=2954381 RepID=UPI002FC27C0D
MNVVVLINGREAIPVRAIPFVTGRWMSPDVVARSFARTDSWRDMREVSAYQLLGGVIHGPILPKEWDVVEDLLQALEAKLDSLSDNHTDTRPIWISESVSVLPASVFVWKDQFEQYFRGEYSPWRFHKIDERPGDRELNFSPMITPPSLRDVVMEGFEDSAGDLPQIPPTPINNRQSLLRRRKSVTLEEAAEMLTGIEGWTKENRAAIDLMRESIQHGELEPENVHYWNEDAWTFDGSRAVLDQGATTVTVANFEAWRARIFPSTDSGLDRPKDSQRSQAGFSPPDAFQQAVTEGTPTADTPPPQAPAESQGQTGTAHSGTPQKAAPEVTPVAPKKKDLVAWQDVVLENWPKIAEHKKKPPAREVMKWLRNDGPRDTFPAESRPARDSLCWIDGDGGSHTLTITRLSTVLAEWRKAGKIPA